MKEGVPFSEYCNKVVDVFLCPRNVHRVIIWENKENDLGKFLNISFWATVKEEDRVGERVFCGTVMNVLEMIQLQEILNKQLGGKI